MLSNKKIACFLVIIIKFRIPKNIFKLIDCMNSSKLFSELLALMIATLTNTISPTIRVRIPSICIPSAAAAAFQSFHCQRSVRIISPTKTASPYISRSAIPIRHIFGSPPVSFDTFHSVPVSPSSRSVVREPLHVVVAPFVRPSAWSSRDLRFARVTSARTC